MCVTVMSSFSVHNNNNNLLMNIFLYYRRKHLYFSLLIQLSEIKKKNLLFTCSLFRLIQFYISIPINRTKSNQRWMKLRTTVQLSSAIQKKPVLKREDSFLKRFSTRQIPETQVSKICCLVGVIRVIK